ncbi:MAG: gliding motility-associated C-terminal domain-containing protein [Flavipsychrobacter sp.]|nr:gliding motility-associated C-terminal domain-containing protein [Flavipsychrobacter sp.]
MKKCLLLAALLVLSQINVKAQQTLFNVSVPSDTVCVNQLISLTSNVTGSSYYWGFCSGYLSNEPTGLNLGNSFHFNDPGAIDVVKDLDSNYYGFVVNTGSTELLRLNYGRSLTNIPTVTNFGNFNNILPDSPSTLYITFDAQFKKWYVFVAGGTNVSNSALARIDFNSSLGNNTPNIVNFGNLYNKMNGPKGLFVGYDADQTRWYGYCVNKASSTMVRFDFDNNISNTPLVNDIGNPGGNSLSNPADMVAQLDNGNWYFFVVNDGNNSLSRIDFGNTLNNLSPIGNPLGINGDQLDNPTSLTITEDCGNYHLFITGKNILVPGGYNVTRVDMGNITGTSAQLGGYYGLNLGNVGQEENPTSISRVIRDYDNVYAFVTDTANNLIRLTFATCQNSSIHSSTSKTPPEFSYTNTTDSPTVYNIYFAVDEGLPTQQVACQTITVLPYPKIFLFPSDTSICMNDTILLRAISGEALTFRWSPLYNISDSVGTSVRAWPKYSLKYNLEVPFADGCVVDTFVNIHVKQVVADAGPDRQISDGGKTILGGPNTSMGSGFTYLWSPNQFLDNVAGTNPVANPANDFTYYLKVSSYLNDSVTCSAQDTVVVHVGCDNIHLPNAFIPGSSNSTTNHFSILNKEIVKLDYFRVFDRWGNKVFETTDPTQGWDGMENSTNAPVGVYVWEIQGYCSAGQRFTRAGNVTLLR